MSVFVCEEREKKREREMIKHRRRLKMIHVYSTDNTTRSRV